MTRNFFHGLILEFFLLLPLIFLIRGKFLTNAQLQTRDRHSTLSPPPSLNSSCCCCYLNSNELNTFYWTKKMVPFYKLMGHLFIISIPNWRFATLVFILLNIKLAYLLQTTMSAWEHCDFILKGDWIWKTSSEHWYIFTYLCLVEIGVRLLVLSCVVNYSATIFFLNKWVYLFGIIQLIVLAGNRLMALHWLCASLYCNWNNFWKKMFRF